MTYIYTVILSTFVQAGRIPSLDTLVASFLSAPSDARTAIVNQANQLSSQFTAKTGTAEATSASYYLKVIDKLSESSDWAQTELARLQKLASKRGNMAQKQLDDLQVRKIPSCRSL
jgi:protein disulfide-isomerase A6